MMESVTQQRQQCYKSPRGCNCYFIHKGTLLPFSESAVQLGLMLPWGL